jgi:hypothetical protein
MSTHERSDGEHRFRSERGHDRPGETTRSETALRRIGDAIHGLRYGSVLAIVQDGVVVQIERTEKTRLDR